MARKTKQHTHFDEYLVTLLAFFFSYIFILFGYGLISAWVIGIQFRLDMPNPLFASIIGVLVGELILRFASKPLRKFVSYMALNGNTSRRLYPEEISFINGLTVYIVAGVLWPVLLPFGIIPAIELAFEVYRYLIAFVGISFVLLLIYTVFIRQSFLRQ